MIQPIRICARAIIIRDQAILAVKYVDQGGVYYALPGGGQLHGESLPETVLRECQEELGIVVQNRGLKFIREYVGKDGDSAWRDAGMHQIEFIFECGLARGEEPKGGTHRDSGQIDLSWLPIQSLANFRFYPKKLVPYLKRPLPEQIEYWGNVE